MKSLLMNFKTVKYTLDNYPSKLTDFLLEQQAFPQQSKAYLDFYSKTEENAFVLTLEDSAGKVLIYSLIVKHSKKIFKVVNFNYLYTIFGPVINKGLDSKTRKKVLSAFFKELKRVAKREKAIFTKVYPFGMASSCGYKVDFLPPAKEIETALKISGAVEARGYHIPKMTAILPLKDFTDSEDILKQMKSKWRYNIRLAQKKGVEVEFSKDKGYAKDFYRLMKITAERQKWTLWPYSKYKLYFNALLSNEVGEWVIARFHEKMLGVIFVIKFGKIAVYVRGASSNEYREKMPNHLIHFKTIERLMKEGYEYYDFYGVGTDPDDSLTGGISNFKYGFFSKKFSDNEKIVHFPKTYDFINNKGLYRLYNKFPEK